MLKKTQTEVNRWQIALNKTVLFYLMNTMNNFFFQLLCCTCRLHMVPLSLFRLALYCLRAMRIPAPFLNFLFWGEPVHMHYSGKWLEYAPWLKPTGTCKACLVWRLWRHTVPKLRRPIRPPHLRRGMCGGAVGHEPNTPVHRETTISRCCLV